ncbi:MAG TPA: toll/interleukin-1 receptor domain-containing protein, partial [Terrimicrobiaceae bacterium]|nr:toll/interleukin-1 receptor domain-containing protein [Terrimicrobiaceae bacterium]
MAQVFISYSRKDETFAQRLAAALAERNRDVWLDREDIEFTADWKQRVLAGIEGATIFVSILSPEYATSAVCREEADHAIEHNKRLVPLLRRAVDFNSLHPAISALNALPFEETDDFDAGVSKLLQAIDTDFEWLDQHTRLLQRAIEWEGKARESSLALRGNDLRAAEQWIAQAGTTQDRNPTQLQTEYILASRRASTRRLRVLLGLAIAAVVITAILAIAALVQRGIAVQRTKEVSQSLSRSDFLESTRRLGADETGAALAHLARALRVDPENSVAQRRLISLLSQRNWQFPAQEPLRHDDFVWSAELSPDGKRIVTSYGAGTVQLWDLETGKPIGGPSRYPTVATATFNRDGSRIAVICELDPGEESTRGSWQILDGLTGNPLTNRIEEAGPITATAFSADGSKFLLGVQEPAGGVVRVASIASGESPRTLLKFGAAVPAAFDAIGARVIALSHERNDADKATVARVWSLGSGKPATAPFKHDAEIQGAIFSPDGDHIATWAWVEARIFVWNLDSDRLAFSTSPASDDLALSRVAYSPDGSLLLSTHVGHPSRESDWTVRVLDAKTSEEVRSEIRDHGRFTGAVFSPSGKYLLVASSGSRARVWPVRSGDEIEPREAVAPLEHGDVVQAALMTPDDRRIVTASFDRTLQIWQATPELGRALPAELPSAQPVFFVERSSRGSRIATIFAEPPGARIWDAATQQPLSDSLSLQEMQQGVRFSGDEKLMIARSNDGVYRVWDAGSGRLVRQLKSPSGAPIEAAVLNFNGNRAAVTDKEGTLLVDLTADRTIKLPIEAGEQSHPTLEVTPDGKRLLTLSDKRLSLWDAETGARVWGPVPSQTESMSVQFSPDGRRFAVFGADPMV